MLLRRAAQIYQALGFFMVYGQFDTGSMLERFYQRQGFNVLNEGEGVDVGFLLAGTSRYLTAGPGERMFCRWVKN